MSTTLICNILIILTTLAYFIQTHDYSCDLRNQSSDYANKQPQLSQDLTTFIDESYSKTIQNQEDPCLMVFQLIRQKDFQFNVRAIEKMVTIFQESCCQHKQPSSNILDKDIKAVSSKNNHITSQQIELLIKINSLDIYYDDDCFQETVQQKHYNRKIKSRIHEESCFN